MQPMFSERALYPAFLPGPCAFYQGAGPPSPSTKLQEEPPAKKRPFTVEFLLSKSPPEGGDCSGQPLQVNPGAAWGPGPGDYPVLSPAPAYHPQRWYSRWNMYGADWRCSSPSPLLSPSPAKEVKLKRFRAIFTQEQLAVLEREFRKSRYIVGPQRVTLAAVLGLTVLQVKVWFQNRRIKWKKDAEKPGGSRAACEGPSEDSPGSRSGWPSNQEKRASHPPLEK
ncbi:homeobox protein Nkx-6.3-like [Scyliorhinus torazame]|uniref:homeobox protein Nkx-6.3-like n=1 Tax=Scyliorhinus torazame TaxID=75743 RepID=UPI003B5CA748